MVEGAENIRQRLAFLTIDDEARAALAEFLPSLRTALPDILVKFYDHLRKWPELAGMFQGAAAMERAAKAQEGHWLNLFSGRFDDDYVASVRKIGLMHSRIGLDPRWYIGGYSFILGHLYSLAANTYASRLSPATAQLKTARLLRALNQAVMLDVDMAISIYLEENKAAFDKQAAGLVDGFEAALHDVAAAVASAATELHATVQSMAATAEETSPQPTAAAAAAEPAMRNVHTAGSVSEELASSIKEILQQVVHLTRIIGDAVMDLRHLRRSSGP